MTLLRASDLIARGHKRRRVLAAMREMGAAPCVTAGRPDYETTDVAWMLWISQPTLQACARRKLADPGQHGSLLSLVDASVDMAQRELLRQFPSAEQSKGTAA